MARYAQTPDAFRANKDNKKRYDSIVNLQLLPKGQNAQKGDTPLKEWVENQTKGNDRQQFLDARLIPDVLDEADIEKFLEERETLLINQLTKVLGI
jgi:hypothetical protein